MRQQVSFSLDRSKIFSVILSLVTWIGISYLGYNETARFTDTIHLYLYSIPGGEAKASFVANNDPDFLAPFADYEQTFEAEVSQEIMSSKSFADRLTPFYVKNGETAFWFDVNDENQKQITQELGIKLIPLGRYILLKHQEKYYLSGRRQKISARDYNIANIQKIHFIKTSMALAVVQNYSVSMFKKVETDGVNDFSLKEISVFRKMHFYFSLAMATLLAIFVFWITSAKNLKSIREILKENLLIMVPVCLLGLIFYGIFWPGIYGMDVVAAEVYLGIWNSWFSTIYMLMARLLSPLGYGFFVIIHLFLFWFVLCQLLWVDKKNEKMGLQKQLAIALILILFIVSQGGLLSIYGVQRFFTTPWFLFASWACLFRAYFFQRENGGGLLATSLVLYTVAILMRNEYLIFAPLYLWVILQFLLEATKKRDKSFFLSVGLGILGCLLLFAVIGQIEYVYKLKSNSSNIGYVNSSLKIMAEPYLKTTQDTPINFQRNSVEVTAEELKEGSAWFLNQVLKNPSPFLSSCFQRFFNALFVADTWQHPHDKFVGFHNHRKMAGECGHTSCHEFYAANFYLNRLDYVPVTKDFYSKTMEYVQFNRPWIKSGVVVAILLMIFVLPVIFSGSLFLLLTNFLLLGKTLATILFAPAGFGYYYFDTVIWVTIAAIVLVRNFRTIRRDKLKNF